MPRKKLSDDPALNEDGQVMADYTIKFTAPHSVDSLNAEPIEETGDSEETDDSEEADDSEEPINYKFADSSAFVQQLRAVGVVPENGYALKIEKFPPESLDSGPRALKMPCGRFVFTANELLAKAHLAKVKQYGPGRYWLTLRGPERGAIMTNWELMIDDENADQVISPISSQSPHQPLPPNFSQTVQQPAINPFDEVDKALALVERVEKLRSRDNPAPIVPAISGELAMAQYLMTQPQAAKAITKNLLGGNGESEGMLGMILSNAEPIGKAIEGIIGVFFANLQNMKDNNATPGAVKSPQPTLAKTSNPPGFNAQTELAKLLAEAASNPTIMPVAQTASSMIELSDYADANNLFPTISHFVESFARFDPAESLPVFNLLTSQNKTLTELSDWLTLLKTELQEFYIQDEQTDAAPIETEHESTVPAS